MRRRSEVTVTEVVERPAVRVPPASAGPRVCRLGKAREFARALRAVRPFASEDTTRPTLSKVHLSVAQDGVLSLYATDGHTLARWRETKPLVDYVPLDMGIALEDADKLAKVFAREDGEMTLSDRTFDVSGAGDRVQMIVGEAERAAPPYETVIPRAAPGKVARIGAQPYYLIRAFEAFRVAARGMKDAEGELIVAWTALEFTGSELDPMRVTSPHVPELLAIVMPCKL